MPFGRLDALQARRSGERSTAHAQNHRTRLSAWLTAIGLHALFAVCFLGTLSGGGMRGATDPFGEGEAIEVTLSGHEGRREASSENSVNSRQAAITALARRLAAISGDPTSSNRAEATSAGDLDSLFGAGSSGGRGQRGDGTDAAGRSKTSGPSPLTAQASLQGDRGAATSSGDFIGQVDACWRALPLRSRTVVTLEVTLNDRGRLATKPTILRAPGAQLDEARLMAEAAALTAIQTCLPSKSPPLPGLQQSYRLIFDPARRGR